MAIGGSILKVRFLRLYVYSIDSDSSDEDDKEWDDIGQNIIEKFSEPNPSMSNFINLEYFR